MTSELLTFPTTSAEPAGFSRLLISADDLARVLDVSLRSVRTLDAAGKLPRPVRLGRLARWDVAEVRAWLEAGAPDRKHWENLKRAAK